MLEVNKLSKIDLDVVYNNFDEDTRLNTSKASSVEFLTTIRFIERDLRKNSSIIDVGAGTGAYSVYFADRGHEVVAVEPVKKNLDILKQKIVDKKNIKAVTGNAMDLSMYESHSFDLVLCLGPLYSLRNFEEQKKCVEEVYRICKKGINVGMKYFKGFSNKGLVRKCDRHNAEVCTDINTNRNK